LRDDLRCIRIRGREYANAILGRRGRDAVEPDCLARSVRMRDDEGYLDAVREQNLEAANAHVVVRKYNGAGHGARGPPDSRSSTA